MSYIRNRTLLACSCLLAALAAPCAAVLGETRSAIVIATAGAVELGESDVRGTLAALPETSRAAALKDASALEQLVRAELVRRLVIGEARAAGFEREAAAAAEFARLRDDALVRLWVERQAKLPQGYPSEAEVERAYAAARERSAAGSEYRLAQIFIAAADGAAPQKVAAALRKAADVQGRLAAGDFGELARSYSENADSAAKGGDLGYVPESHLLPEVRAAVADLKVGAVAGPIKTTQGLHFVKVTDKRAASVAPLAEVREALVTALRQQRSAELQRRYLAELGAKSPPSVNQVELGKLRAGLK
jgi:parvulin-like peptidyl-prolyl isomerase